MDEFSQVRHLEHDLDRLIERARKEYVMTYASVIGTLQVKIHQLCVEANDSTEETE